MEAVSPTSAPFISPYSAAHLHTKPQKNSPRQGETPKNVPKSGARTGQNCNPAEHDDVTEMTVLADGTVMKLQKSRQRKVFSCVTCHKKKIKCSRDQPICRNCQKTDAECKYFVNKRVSRGGRKAKEAAREAKENERKTQFMESAPFDDSGSIASSELTESTHMAHRNSDPHSDVVSTGMSVTTSVLSNSAANENPLVDFANYSGSSLSPDPNPKLPGFTENGFPPVKGDEALAEANLAYSGIADFTASNLRHIPSSDSVSNMTNKFFNTNYHTATSNPANVEEPFGLSMGSMCFTPLPEIGFNGLKSPMVNMSMNGKIEAGDKKAETVSSHQNQAASGAAAQKGNSQYSSFSNFVDGPASGGLITSNISSSLSAQPPKNPAPLVAAQDNSLNPYTSNPAMTVNYLYGTNVNYHKGGIYSSLIEHLPSKERSFELIERYFHSVHDLLPILVNVVEFRCEHERFWAQFNPPSSSSASSKKDSESMDVLQFYTLYFPVIYAATISEFEEYDNLLLNQDIDKYLKAFNKICQHYNYPHGLKSISILLGNVIIQSTSPNPSTMEMSQIIRYAKFLHLHKDPVKTLRIQDWKVVGFRRKLWWVIFGLDALSSHNFCLPPVCRFGDFNVEIPEHYDPVFSENGTLVGRQLNISVLAMSVKFRFDRILSDLVYHLHNGLSSNISNSEIDAIRDQISALFGYIHQAVLKINMHYKKNPPKTVNEMNMFNFVKHHSWSFADRALMLLHKKILLTDRHSSTQDSDSFEMAAWTRRSGPLSLCEYEDTFGRIQEANIIKNFDESSIALLRFSQSRSFSYEDLQTNLIPSILHNLNDFLKYNDFIKFGKFNWYVKRTIPLDSIILLLVVMCVKLKYDYMGTSELVVFVKLVNKTLFILNRKYFKNEKYKRMLSLTNTTWEYILKKFSVLQRVTGPNGNTHGCVIEFVDHQVAGILNMSELFTIMDVPQPTMVINGQILMPSHGDEETSFNREPSFSAERDAFEYHSPLSMSPPASTDELSVKLEVRASDEEKRNRKTELLHLNQKIYYDLRNNFVDINDYCTFYSSLENVLHALMDYINDK